MKERAEFMTASQTKAMGKLPRTHQNCLEKTGVARPGKTAKERARRGGR
jgi:hypothetical protein